MVINRGKISKVQNKVKSVKNINKKESSQFSKDKPVQKEAPPSHKIQDYAYA